jgi:hypothetical protein
MLNPVENLNQPYLQDKDAFVQLPSPFLKLFHEWAEYPYRKNCSKSEELYVTFNVRAEIVHIKRVIIFL